MKFLTLEKFVVTPNNFPFHCLIVNIPWFWTIWETGLITSAEDEIS